MEVCVGMVEVNVGDGEVCSRWWCVGNGGVVCRDGDSV